MSIPQNITVDHVISAIKEILKNGIPSKRQSKIYNLVLNSGVIIIELLPPKYVISIANKYANGSELAYNQMNGGWGSQNPNIHIYANDFLSNLGFHIR